MPNSSTANVAPPAANHTTPHKRTSGQASTPESTPTAPRTQETLLDAMPLELGDQVWEVDVETTRRMLSPKKFRSDVDKKDSYPSLESFTCFVDDPQVQPAMKSMPIPGPLTRWDTAAERVNYEPTATFLNNCVDNCVNALKRLRKSNNDLRDHWWTSLKFFVYDKPTKDGVEGAAPLKPDLVGVASGEAGDLVCYWSPPDSGKSGILLPVEVKKSWTEIIKQAATYARAMVSAAPLRLFSVVIGVNHLKGTLRFLIYHRGGLTMSHQISLQEPQGRRDVQSIIFAILLWRNHEDAGFPSCTSGPVSMLPSGDKNESVKLKTNEVLFSSLSIRGRGTCVLWATPEHEEPPQSSSLRPIRQTRRVTRVALEADTTNSQATRQGTTSSQAGRQGTTSSQVARQGTRSSQRQGTKRGATKREPLHTVDKNSAVKGESAVNDEPVDVIEPWRHLSYKPCYTPPPNLIGAPRPITREQFPDGLVMKYSFPHSAKRGIEAHVYEWCSGQFGVPIHLCTFEACRSDGGAFSNSFLLPSATSFEEHRSHSAFSSTKSPPDRRALQVIVTAEKGTSLEHCENVAELLTCVLHAQLGWLAMIGFTRSGGYLHRDVSIGNVIRLDKPAQRPAFNIRERMAGLVHPPDIVEGMKNLRVDSQDSDGDGFWKDLIVATTEESLKAVVRAAERLEKALAQVGLSTECLAVLIDSDMAAPLEGYFSSSEHSGVISGTPEFMSERLIAALREVELTYVQNPVDDLKSFMWTTVWGAVFNPRADGSQMQNRLVHWRRMLRTHERLSALSAIEGSVLDDSSPIVKGISSLIRMWRRELEDLEVKFGYAFKKALNADQKLHVFYQSALEGVALYAELLHELRETLGLKLEVTQ